MKIFYADDDQDEIDFFIEALKLIDRSIECITAPDGYKALQLLETIAAPDLIFLDLNMPRLNGKDCLISIKNNRRLKNIPVIIYSSAASEKDIFTLQKEGACKVLSKTWGIAQLSKELRSLILVKPHMDRQMDTSV
jgi:CheY-like chemotaxis protein